MVRVTLTGKYFLGIDPGGSGGLALLGSRDSEPKYLTKMPDTDRDLWNFVEMVGTIGYPVEALIENVSAMPGQGVSSTFKFGVNYGKLQMSLTASGIRYSRVTPRKWQAGVGVVPRKKTESKTQFKNRLKSRAQELFPSEKITLAVADALLIAEYARRTLR